MRYIVTFAHRKYTAINDALWHGEPGYQIPEGVYRQLAVVVEAEGADCAVDKALGSLGWPHDELDLVPMGVASQDEVAEALRRHRPYTPAPV